MILVLECLVVCFILFLPCVIAIANGAEQGVFLYELAVMDGSKCIVQVRGVRPFLSDKYDLTQHPNFKYTADADKKNWFDVETFLDHKLVLKEDDEYEVIEVTE